MQLYIYPIRLETDDTNDVDESKIYVQFSSNLFQIDFRNYFFIVLLSGMRLSNKFSFLCIKFSLKYRWIRSCFAHNSFHFAPDSRLLISLYGCNVHGY